MTLVLAAVLLASSRAQSFPKPGSAGAGYVSKKLRKPKWQPTFNMRASTKIMPCNYSGYYNMSTLADYGWIQFDWSNRKDLWCQDKPMSTSETISTQAQLAHAALPSAKIGVYRPGVKAINLFREVREKLDDPAYSGSHNRTFQHNRFQLNRCTHSRMVPQVQQLPRRRVPAQPHVLRGPMHVPGRPRGASAGGQRI